MAAWSRCQQLGSFVLMAAVCLLLVGCGGSKVTADNYKKISNDMTEAQVKDILGAPSETKEAGPSKVSVWKSGNDTVSVTFIDGKVKMKISSYDAADLLKGVMPK